VAFFEGVDGNNDRIWSWFEALIRIVIVKKQIKYRTKRGRHPANTAWVSFRVAAIVRALRATFLSALKPRVRRRSHGK
jgi:hypothetical protein